MQQEIARHEQTDIRVMSWNILSEELTPTAPPIEDRIDAICEVIMSYRPDMAGIQEISEKTYQLLAERIGDTYDFINPRTHEGLFSFTGITYDKTKYRLLESNIENYELGNRRIRLMNWIYVEEISSGRRVVLMSTHWDRHACNRVPDAEQMGKRVKELEQKYSCPVICTGDYNAKESTAAYQTFMKLSEYGDAKYLCENPINNVFTGHAVGDFTPEYEGTECIDHIIMSDSYEVLHYEAVCNKKVIDVSDHLPIYVDLKIK